MLEILLDTDLKKKARGGCKAKLKGSITHKNIGLIFIQARVMYMEAQQIIQKKS